jgi:hypothetical protein
MNWRKLALLAAGLLLPLPLLMIGKMFFGPSAPLLINGRAVSPLLSQSKKLKLSTFERPCRNAEDCEPPLACLDLGGPRSSLCVASECQTDLQCKEGFSCRVLATPGAGPLVRFCVPEGPHGEGHPCHEAPARKEDACQRGLICAGWCGRSCKLDEPSICPQGFFCEGGLNGPSCLPSCTPGDCPTGKQCVHFRGRIAACMPVRGENCQEIPCPSGQKCTFSYSPADDQIAMECVQPCDETHPACPQGSICFSSTCRRVCDSSKNTGCGPDEQCVFHPDDQFSLCYPRRH